MSHDWVGPELERHLRPVTAPDELWDRVQNPRARRPVIAWKLAFAAMVVMATAWALHPRTASFESDRAGDIRDWVKARTGLDIPLSPAAPLHLCGSRVMGDGTAEIRYRLHDREATLLVAKAERFTSGHEFVTGTTWILHGQSYTATGDLQGACLLCHLD